MNVVHIPLEKGICFRSHSSVYPCFLF